MILNIVIIPKSLLSVSLRLRNYFDLFLLSCFRIPVPKLSSVHKWCDLFKIKNAQRTYNHLYL